MDRHYLDETEIAFLKQLGERLDSEKLSVASAESCTGGRIASLITSVPGSSEHFVGGIVSYSEEIKKDVLGVSADDIRQYGVVSREVARQMALGAARVFSSPCAVSTTGVAGPDGGTDENPVGTVWITVMVRDDIQTRRFVFSGDRQQIVRQASMQALRMLSDMLG